MSPTGRILSNADQVISGWMEVQRKWMYLESISKGSEDIRNQLPMRPNHSRTSIELFKILLADIIVNLNVLKATNKAGLSEKLDMLLKQLVLCGKALNDSLYFVLSADFLDILSNGNAPELVARHLLYARSCTIQ